MYTFVTKYFINSKYIIHISNDLCARLYFTIIYINQFINNIVGVIKQ